MCVFACRLNIARSVLLILVGWLVGWLVDFLCSLKLPFGSTSLQPWTVRLTGTISRAEHMEAGYSCLHIKHVPYYVRDVVCSVARVSWIPLASWFELLVGKRWPITSLPLSHTQWGR